MKTILQALIACLLILGLQAPQLQAQKKKKVAQKETPTLSEKVAGMQAYPGFFNFWWDAKSGKIWMQIEEFGEDFLYLEGLASGVGSNDIGLDRGQLGNGRILRFERIGPKVLLIERNLGYRAESDNPAERKSVEEAFAQSVLAGFAVEVEENGSVLVDFTPFILRDAHKVTETLRRTNQGKYTLEPDRSAVYTPALRGFPDNSEFEAWLTFSGDPEGDQVKRVVPSPEAITVRQHHSLIRLPDNDFEPRKLDPRSGFFGISYFDYATPIDQPLEKRFIARHRLEKKNPSAELSEAIEPIVYYLDPGTPEPVASALLEGAQWWNEAFEAAGFKDAFRVEILPEEADPLDVRYNMIQWVHRSTRGWSYGNAIVDPRTGEIIKGHVSLGSLRVRQDVLIAQGLYPAFGPGGDPDKLKEMALARLRQLSAHEVGHTLGLAHNFAASINHRASVMDYPHPYVYWEEGEARLDSAYDTGIGEWDKRSILYGYSDYPAGVDEDQALTAILEENKALGLYYLTNEDARPVSSASPLSHLWDNGSDPAKELNRVMDLRKKALGNFGPDNLPVGRPLAELEDILVPLYFGHRYQLEAAVKVIGGFEYHIATRGENYQNRLIPSEKQMQALASVLNCLDPEALALPNDILMGIPPRPAGWERGREHFETRTDFTLDPLGNSEALSAFAYGLLLHPARAARLKEFMAIDPDQPGLGEVLNRMISHAWDNIPADTYLASINQGTRWALLSELFSLATNQNAGALVKAEAHDAILRIEVLAKQDTNDEGESRFRQYMSFQITRYLKNPSKHQPKTAPGLPDGSPIGMAPRFYCGAGASGRP